MVTSQMPVSSESMGKDLLKVLVLAAIFVAVMFVLKYFDDKSGFLTVLAERIVKI